MFTMFHCLINTEPYGMLFLCRCDDTKLMLNCIVCLNKFIQHIIFLHKAQCALPVSRYTRQHTSMFATIWRIKSPRKCTKYENMVYLSTPGTLLYNVRAKTQSLSVALLALSSNHLTNSFNIFTVPFFPHISIPDCERARRIWHCWEIWACRSIRKYSTQTKTNVLFIYQYRWPTQEIIFLHVL